MEEYRKKLKVRILLLSIIVVILIIVQFNFSFSNIVNSNSPAMLPGFQAGLMTGIIILFCVMIIKYISALSNKTSLKIRYNIENDERRKNLKMKAGGNVILFNSICFIIAGIIAGYYNELVFYVLVACAMFQLAVSAILKVYYLKKY